MKKYAPQTLEKSSRAQINKCVAVEIREGRGTSNGCVYLDLSDVSGEYLKEKIPYNLKTFLSRGIDLTYQPMELCPVVHTFLGGVEIDEFGRTRLNSLYSAGEVTGGLHGANRLGGNALSDALGMGSIAGRQAALQSKSSEFRSAEEAQVHEEKARIKKLLERNFGVDPTKVRDELQTLMWKNVGIVRDGHELSSNLEALERLKEELLPKLYVSGKDLPQELRRALELENMVLVAEIITRAALMRKESRGVHTRLDYPETDPEWLKNIIICRENDEMRILTRPVVELPKQ
jgi:fumarate reductase (CoM/CoB) subunit A